MGWKTGKSSTAGRAARIAGVFLLALTGNAAAQESGGSLALELNGLAPSEKGCLMTFVVKNGLANPLEKAAFEIVLFNGEGLVDRMTVLEFADLPQGKTKVQQFNLPGADCAAIDRVLVNDAAQCAGEGVAPDACIARLTTATKSDVAFGS